MADIVDNTGIGKPPSLITAYGCYRHTAFQFIGKHIKVKATTGGGSLQMPRYRLRLAPPSINTLDCCFSCSKVSRIFLHYRSSTRTVIRTNSNTAPKRTGSVIPSEADRSPFNVGHL